MTYKSFLLSTILLMVVIPGQLIFAYEGNPVQQHFLFTTRQLFPGDPLIVEIPDREYAFVSARITNPRNRTVSSAEGFLREAQNSWYLFLALPNTMPPGYYRFEIAYTHASGRSTTLQRIFRVHTRDFNEEIIPLNRQQTLVRTSNPQQRAAESETLGRILSTANPQNWFWTGTFIFPLESIRRTAYYGDRRVFVYDDGTRATSIHLGVDYGGPTGTPVFAPGDGMVVFAAFRQVTGWTLVLEHVPGLFTLYFHLDSLNVTLNQLVRQGQIIGKLGSTGLSTGPHLHWEARILLESVDPEFFITNPILMD